MIVVDPIREYPPSMTTDTGLPARFWCHMTSDIAGDDGRRELLEFARRIGCRPEWRQHWDTHFSHFDLTRSMRHRAIQAGAVEVSPRDVFVKRFASAEEAKAAEASSRPIFGVTRPPARVRRVPSGWKHAR